MGSNLPMGPTPSYITDVADGATHFDSPCVDRLEEMAARVGAGEVALCFVGRALISDPEWCVKVRHGRFHQLTEVYNRGTLIRFAEGSHPVPPAEYARVVRPVDINGKPLSPDQLSQGKRVFFPTSVPEAAWRAHYVPSKM